MKLLSLPFVTLAVGVKAEGMGLTETPTVLQLGHAIYIKARYVGLQDPLRENEMLREAVAVLGRSTDPHRFKRIAGERLVVFLSMSGMAKREGAEGREKDASAMMVTPWWCCSDEALPDREPHVAAMPSGGRGALPRGAGLQVGVDWAWWMVAIYS